MNKQLPFIIVGDGDHARVVADLICACGYELLGVTVPDAEGVEPISPTLPVVGTDAEVLKRDPSEVYLANGLGSTRDASLRRKVYGRFRDRGFVFPSLTHPSAVVSPGVLLESGVQVMAGAVIQVDAKIRENVIINTGACIDHDCDIGAHSHIAPGCTLSGRVRIGDFSHVGTGAVFIEGSGVGEGSLVAAGSVVVKRYVKTVTLLGVPASERVSNKSQ